MLPERINVMKVISYDVPEIVGSLKESGEEDINLENVLQYLESWIIEDFGDLNVVIQDENGEEL